MLNILKKSETRKIVYEGYALQLVSHINELQDLKYFDGFIIETDSNFNVREIIKTIRTHKNISVCLQPIFVNSIYKISKENLIHTDGEIEINSISSYIQRVIAITKRIKKIKTPRSLTYQRLIQFKTIAFSYSRNKVLAPVSSRKSFIGYQFPFISLFYKDHEGITLLKNLESANKNNYLSFILNDFVHLCKSCKGNYLNFRECCPKCNSIDISANDMVHHFVCAHVAPEKDFKIDDGLECPKCDKHLRHIGIDYDKPSSIYSCNSCSHEFQNADMKALCLDCNSENKLEELLEKTIGSYKVTEIGENFIFDKGDTVIAEKESISLELMNISLFKLILNQEIKRIISTKGNSFFVQINFKNRQLDALNDNLKFNLTKEISKIIKSYLKASDILAAENYNKYYLLLPETQENQLERLENIQYNLTKLLSDNLQENSQSIEIFTHKIEGKDKINSYFL